MTEAWLHRFPHGLGDVVQLGIVLRHLKHYYPDVRQDVVCRIGTHSALHATADGIYIEGRDSPGEIGCSRVIHHDWPEPYTLYANSPSTKALQCLRSQLKLEPIHELCRYKVHVGPDARKRTGEYVLSLPTNRFITLHTQGNTSAAAKDMPQDVSRSLCNLMAEHGITVILLDWDFRSSLPGAGKCLCPDKNHPLWLGYGTGDAETIAALMQRSACNVCIDSGPQKLAMSVADSGGPPCIGVWLRHHPLHYSDLAGNTLHLIPGGAEEMIRGDKAIGMRYFQENYQYQVYGDVRLGLRDTLKSAVVEKIRGT